MRSARLFGSPMLLSLAAAATLLAPALGLAVYRGALIACRPQVLRRALERVCGPLGALPCPPDQSVGH